PGLAPGAGVPAVRKPRVGAPPPAPAVGMAPPPPRPLPPRAATPVSFEAGPVAPVTAPEPDVEPEVPRPRAAPKVATPPLLPEGPELALAALAVPLPVPGPPAGTGPDAGLEVV